MTLLPLVSFAQTLPPAPITTLTDITGIILTIITWLFTILIFLAVLFIIIAAFKYLTAAGDPEKVKSASNMLIYAAVAIAVALLARGFPTIICRIFGATCPGV